MSEENIVRVAAPADEAEIMNLCLELHSENGQHPVNMEKVRGMVQRCLLQQGGIIGVVGEPGDIKGCICILIDPVWYSDQLQLLELFNFVRPDARQSGSAKQLILYGKKCADETGLDLMIGVLSNIRMEGKVRLYGRLLPKAGEFFCYRPSSPSRSEAA